MIRCAFGRAWPLLLVAGLGAVVYGRSLWFGFYYDDLPAIVHNPAVRTWGAALASLFRGDTTSGFDHVAGYRPLTVLSYALNYAMSGADPWSYHATNVTLLVAAALGVFALARTMRVGRLGAATAAAMTLLHPLAVEAAVYTSARSSVLAALGVVVSLAAFARAWTGGSMAWYAVALVAGGAACLAKESAAVLPALAWGLTAPGVSRDAPSAFSRRVRWVAPFAALIMVYILVRGAVAPYPVSSIPPGEAARSLATMIGESIRLLTIPTGLTIDHWVSPATDVGFAAAAAGGWVLGMILLGIVVGRRVPRARFGVWMMSWSLVPMIPLAFSTRVALIQEHRLILAVIGLGLAMGAGVDVWRERSATPWRRAAVSATAALLVLVCAAGSWARVGVWRSDEALWRDAVVKAPESPLAHTWLGTVAERQGREEVALGEFRLALQSDPGYVFAWMAMARVQHARRDRPSARQAYQSALAINAGYTPALAGLGMLAQEEGDLARAEAIYREVLTVAPRDVSTRNNLAAVFLARGAYQAARDQYLTVLAIDPDQPRVLTNLGYTHLQSGDRAAAIASLRRAFALDPTDLRAAWYLGEALARGGEWAEAEVLWRRAERLPEVAFALSRLYDRTGRPLEAAEAARRALAAAPDTPAYAGLRAAALRRVASPDGAVRR